MTVISARAWQPKPRQRFESPVAKLMMHLEFFKTYLTFLSYLYIILSILLELSKIIKRFPYPKRLSLPKRVRADGILHYLWNARYVKSAPPHP